METETDKEKALVYAWCEAMNEAGRGNAELDELLREAYEDNEHRRSNGCNFVNELKWPFPRHPACVVHDRLYRLQRGRKYADDKMRELNKYFGRPVAGWVRWAGLRLFGGWAYRYGD